MNQSLRMFYRATISFLLPLLLMMFVIACEQKQPQPAVPSKAPARAQVPPAVPIVPGVPTQLDLNQEWRFVGKTDWILADQHIWSFADSTLQLRNLDTQKESWFQHVLANPIPLDTNPIVVMRYRMTHMPKRESGLHIEHGTARNWRGGIILIDFTTLEADGQVHEVRKDVRTITTPAKTLVGPQLLKIGWKMTSAPDQPMASIDILELRFDPDPASVAGPSSAPEAAKPGQVSPPATQESPKTLVATVTDDADQPLAGAVIHLNAEHANRRNSFSTNEQGQAQIVVPAGLKNYQVRVQAPGYMDRVLAVDPSRREDGIVPKLPEKFVLFPCETYEGQVQNEQGQPIENAVVALRVNSPNEGKVVTMRDHINQTTRTKVYPKVVRRFNLTDVQGRWNCSTIIRQATVTGCVFHPDHLSFPGDADSRFYKYVGVNLSELSQRNWKVVLTPAKNLSGQLVDPQGNPVSGADLTYYNRYPEDEVARKAFWTESAKDGTFTLRKVNNGVSTLVVYSRNFAPQVLSLSESLPEPLVIRLDPGKTLRIQIVDEKGKPAVGQFGSLSGWKGVTLGYSSNFKTDAQGMITLPHAPEGSMWLSLMAGDFSPTESNEVVVQDEIVKITRQRIPKFTIRAQDAVTQKPITKFTLYQGLQWGTDGPIEWNPAGQGMQQQDGEIIWKPIFLDLAIYLRVEADKYNPAETKQLDLHKGDQEIVFKLEPDTGIVIKPKDVQ